MAQDGIDYFPLDTGFLRDKKVLLIKGKYGAKGILILIHILCRIYEEHGYYINWDEDDCFLSADAIGSGVSPELTTQVVNECVVRSMFDEQLYNEFGILTSHGIQWRFIRAAKKRENIEFYHPVYDTPEKIDNGSPDNRTTVYWNPYVETAPDGTAAIEFYTNDTEQADYDITIEGIAPDGTIYKSRQKL